MASETPSVRFSGKLDCMLDYIFNTNLYYYAEGTGELCTARIALTYPWKSPHTRDVLRWICFDHTCSPPFFGIHPLPLLRQACTILSMELSERACFFKYEDASSRDMSKSFHSERYISIYKQIKIAKREQIRTLEKKQKREGTHPPVHKTEEECEKLLKREEYKKHLQKYPNAQSREMEFYYYMPKKGICTLSAREWAPVELKAGLWAYKPCVIEGGASSHLEGGETTDPLHALINSLQSITQYLVTYAEEHGILRYFVVKEGDIKNATAGNSLDVSFLKFTLKAPVLWGLALRMEPSGDLIMD